MFRRLAAMVIAGSVLAACNQSGPPAPDTGDPGPGGGVVPISGRERLGWNQWAADAAQLALFRYVVYVDGTRASLSDVRCGPATSARTFECSAALPPMTPGAHSIELAAVVQKPSGAVESVRSAPLRVVVTGDRRSPSSSRSKRLDGSQTSGSAERRNSATTCRPACL
jgi:hypothetical protein